jgi:hypothetical protein
MGRQRAVEEARFWREGVEGREVGYVPGTCPWKTVVSDSCAGQERPSWRLQDGWLKIAG